MLSTVFHINQENDMQQAAMANAQAMHKVMNGSDNFKR
jgi:hypothetical protein